MSNITTEDCKNFIVDHFNNQGMETKANEWKRTSKYKENTLWVRDFSHETLGVISLIEKNEVLKINIVKIEENLDFTYFKKFTKQEVSGAKKLVNKLLQIRQDIEGIGDEYDLQESKDWAQYNHALPSQFTFCFPFETPYGVYHNELTNITNGLDSPMFFNQEESFNIIFIDKNTAEMDYYTSDILQETILPKWAEFIDEYSVEVNYKAPKNLTVKEFIHILFDLGFEYKVGSEYAGLFEYDCLFEKEIKDYLLQLTTNLNAEKKSTKPKI